jgi:glycosyltransferase involved in cell wall biosynthesis
MGGSKFGGDSVLVLEMARDARERGFEVDILATDPHFQDLIRAAGIGLVDLDVIRREIRPLWDTRGLRRLTRFLRESSYTIVHTHTSKPGVIGRLAATRAGVPVVVHTVHGFGFHEETGVVETAAYRTIERTAARWCDRIVTVSEFHRQWALRAGIGTPEQIVAIPNGVPSERAQASRARSEVRCELGLTERLMILSTGRLAEQKGLEYLIRAAPLLRRTRPDARILLAGDGPLKAELTRLVNRLGVGDLVRVLGFRADVADLLDAADLVVLPSLWEGLSISLLEAMAAGKPVITTTIGSNREVTNDGEAALLVPPKNAHAIAEAILALADDPLRRSELARAGREVQAQQYTIGRMLDAYADQYELLLRRKRVPVTAAVRAQEATA